MVRLESKAIHFDKLSQEIKFEMDIKGEAETQKELSFIAIDQLTKNLAYECKSNVEEMKSIALKILNITARNLLTQEQGIGDKQ